MEQVLQELQTRLPEIIQWAFTFLCYFFVFLYRKRVAKTSTVLSLSMTEALKSVAAKKQEIDADQIALIERVTLLEAKCARYEKIIQIYTEGDYIDVDSE